MKEKILIVLLIVSLSKQGFSQDLDNRLFIDIGGGMGYTESIHGAFNAGVMGTATKRIGWNIDYNRFVGKSGMLFNEINIKIGPYYKISNNTFIMVSSGISYFFRSLGPVEENYDDSPFTVLTYKEHEFFSIPIQLKLNIGLNSYFNFGIKGTYNYLFDNTEEDKGTALFFIGVAF